MTNLTYVGFIKKTHGFKGVVKIHIENSAFKPKQTEPLMLDINKKVVPFFIEQISGDAKEWQIKFEDIHSVDEAEEIIGLSAFTERKDAEDPELWEVGAVGYSVIDKHLGAIGEVTDHIQKPGQDLLEVTFNSETFFIPFVEAMIIKVDNKKGILYTDLPEGLININT